MDVRAAARGVADAASLAAATIDVAGSSADDVIRVGSRELDALLPDYLRSQRWFAGKGAQLESARIGDVVPIPSASDPTRPVGHLAMVDVAYGDGRAPERYATTLATFRADRTPASLLDGAELARVRTADGVEHVLADAITEPPLVEGLVHAMRGGSQLQGAGAMVVGGGAAALDDAVRGLGAISVKPLSVHTSNTSVQVAGRDGRQYALKLVRRHDAVAEPGTPTRALDVWKGAYLTNEAGYANTPAVLGSVDHLGSADGLPRTVGVLTEFVPNDGDGWADALGRARAALAVAREGADPKLVDAAIDDYAISARNHGRRLGELHVALSSGGPGSEFRGVLQDAGALQRRTGRLLDDATRTADQLRAAGRADDADALLRGMPGRIDEAERAAGELVPIEEIHTHGDFHLGQLLKTGDDVQIIDLEGAPALALAERWQRTLALDDIARQRSSYEYAATQALRETAGSGGGVEATLRPVADR
jgi:trehalose synthase-fused probable maltokinase